MSGLNGQNWEAKKGVKSHEIAKNTYVQFLLSSASNTSLRILHKHQKNTLQSFLLLSNIISQLNWHYMYIVHPQLRSWRL